MALPEDYKGNVYKSDPRLGSAHIIVTGEVENLKRDVYELDFTDYEYNENYGIYGLLTPQEAWNEVQLGNGALVLIQPQTADYFSPSAVLNVSRFVASATDVELGYWEPPVTDPNLYAYPIYIFRGRAELAGNKPPAQFVFYVDALRRI